MTSLNGNIFRFTGTLWGENKLPVYSPHRGRWSAPEQTIEQAIETQVIWNAIAFIMMSLWRILVYVLPWLL